MGTHDVFNQTPPRGDDNVFESDRGLQDALTHLHAGHDRTRLTAMGAAFGSAEAVETARLANRHPPQLRTHDGNGHRIDEVEFHPAYHALLATALAHGLHGAPWRGGAGAHLERAAGFLMMSGLEPAVLCPVSMTYAAAPALRAAPALQAAWAPGLAATRYDPRALPFEAKTALTMGMGMTEKQGGSDVRANTTRAEPDGDDDWGARVRLTGHKWFFSAPMSDAHLVLAQEAAGLSCFLVPRLLRDGTRNAVRVQRLKDKLGNRANASSEVEFEGALAWRVGESGRGIARILTMGALTRLDCALGSAGCMRRALVLALHHARHRRAFGRRLVELPLMRNVLADLAIESEAATALSLRLAAAVDRTEAAAAGAVDAHEAAVRRLLTPVAKYWVCKRGAGFVQEAMECLGGNGYVEDDARGVMARLYREMPLNSIWEGAGNLMALDLLRALGEPGAAEALEREWTPLRGAHAAVDALVASVRTRLAALPGPDQARRLARDVALLLQAAQLARQAPTAVAEAHIASRLVQAHDAYGQLPPGLDQDALVERALR